MRTAINWRNPREISHAIAAHYETTNLCRLLSHSFNLIVGVIYLTIPYMVVIGLRLMKSTENNDIILQIVTIFVFIISCLAIYIVTSLLASITVKNKNAPKFIYRVFCNRRTMNLMHKLKVENFLSKLCSEYIGFYCLNVFKFTKLSFYEYYVTISCTYILVSNILEKSNIMSTFII